MGKKITTLFIFFLACSRLYAAEYNAIEDRANIPILTPALKEQKVEKIILSNGLQAILVSDPNIDKSGAVLSVMAGSWEDPQEYPGVAHFLEHMLFLGTTKYPEESGFDRFVTEHGGISNAFTSNDYTSYMFSINNDAFEPALDRFASFFREPLFNPSGVARELHAIDQEYGKNLENDDFRFNYVLRELSNPNHPQHGFNIGNTSTLSKVSQETLKKWYAEHYSANLMRLAVFSSLPLEKLKEIVVEDFNSVKNIGKQTFSTNEPIFTNITRSHYIYVDPVKTHRALALVWEIPAQLSNLKDTQPERVLAHMIGDEGDKSLLEELKREGLAESIQAGGYMLARGSQEFYVEIGLTVKGLQNVDLVIERFFQAIQSLKQRGYPEYVFDNIRSIDLLKYQYQQREDTFNQAKKYAAWLVQENMSTLPEKSVILPKMDVEDFKSYLAQLTPEKAAYVILAEPNEVGFRYTKVEKWLNVPYEVIEIPSEKLKAWAQVQPNPKIDLFQPNPFIPKNLRLLDEALSDSGPYRTPHPKKIIENKHALVYFAPDKLFRIPRIYWYFEIKTPKIIEGDAASVVLGELFIKNIEENLNTFSYPAGLAQLEYTLKRTDNGISFTINGYHDKAELLFEKIIEKLFNPEIDEQNFAIYKDNLKREYENFAKDTPLNQGIQILREVIYKQHTSKREKLTAIRKINSEMYKEFLKTIFSENYLQGMLYGNMTEEDAKKIALKLYDRLPKQVYAKEERYRKEVIDLPEDKGPFIIEERIRALGNLAMLTIEYLPFSYNARNTQQLLMQAIGESFFNVLRTKQQTGYIVTSEDEEVERHLFNFFIVQSNTHEVRDLLSRFELFIESYFLDVDKTELSPERFEKIKNVLIFDLEQPPKTFKDMGDLLQLLAFKYDGDFDWKTKRIEAFKKLTYEEFLNLARAMLGRTNKRRLAILLKGNIPEDNVFNYTETNIRNLQDMSQFSGR